MTRAPIAVTDRESRYLAGEYARIAYGQPSMAGFLEEIDATLRRHVPFGPETSVLDIGCGRGYFLKRLQESGVQNVRGIDPCAALVESRLCDGIAAGGFEDNAFRDGEFDLVFTCHTLHHLANPWPRDAVREMSRIARRHIAIVEISNANVPMLAASLLNFRVERNAYSYNTAKIVKLARAAGLRIVHAASMRSGYVSGSSWPYRALARAGSRPYTMLIAEKT
jgi:2-polyprenyl-3-methyl-5-hydroxy-6-metoxy-1,4-benzoquinol methylase